MPIFRDSLKWNVKLWIIIYTKVNFLKKNLKKLNLAPK